jgi:hypothetical protein
MGEHAAVIGASTTCGGSLRRASARASTSAACRGATAQGYSSVVLADARRRAQDVRPLRGLRSGILLSGGRGL